MKILIVYYSMYGHVHKMAEAVAEGAREIDGAEAVLRRVPETLPEEVLEKMGAVEAQQSMSNVPICKVDELASADAIIFGTPTRFGNMCGQMRQFLDATGQLWVKRRVGWEGGKCFYQQCNATRWTGINYTLISHNPSSPWFCCCWPALHFSGADAD